MGSLLLPAVAALAAPGALPGMPGAHDGEVRAQRLPGLDEVLRGWNGFADGWVMLDMGIVLVTAVLLGAAIAYHPLTRGKASSLDELEQPKTFIMYAMVGAVIAQIVELNPAMALVVFGIGGLLRFRTNVGQAKDTGRVILVTVVGLCCGLKMIVIAVFATAFGWLLIWYMERSSVDRMQIKGLDREVIARATEAYRQILSQAGCTILGEKKKIGIGQGQLAFVFRGPRGLDHEVLEQQFETLPKELRGAVDWDVA